MLDMSNHGDMHALAALPDRWVHLDWVHSLGGRDDQAVSISRLLADLRLRPAAERMAARHGVSLGLAEADPALLEDATRTVIRALVRDAEQFVLLLGHIAMHEQIRACLVGPTTGEFPAFERPLARMVLGMPRTTLDALAPPALHDPWVEGWLVFATWLGRQSDNDRAFLRLVLPIETDSVLRDCASRTDEEAVLAAIGSLLAMDGADILLGGEESTDTEIDD